MFQILLNIHIISIAVLFAESAYVFVKMKTDLQKYLFLTCLGTLISNIGYLVEMTAQSYETYLRGLQVSYVGKVWIPFSLLVFILKISKAKVNKYVLLALACVHATVAVLVATTQMHTIYYSALEYRTENVMFPYIHTTGGIAHKLYDMILMGYIFVGLTRMIWYTCCTKNKSARKRLFIILLAVLANVLGYLFNLMKLTGQYDCTTFGYAVAAIFMAIAIYRYNLLDTLQFVKDFAIDELSEAIFAVDIAGKIEYYNKPALMLLEKFGGTMDEALERVNCHVQNNTPLELNDRIYTPNVKELVKSGASYGKVYALVDDTEHYRYLGELKKQKDISEQVSASKSRFLSVVSHEIRTPMNAIVGMTDLMLREPEQLSGRQQQYLRNIKHSGESLVMIVNDILDQSKIEAGKMELVIEDYELRPMVDDVKFIIENRIGTKPIELIIEIADNLPRFLSGDSLRIRQILINLMNNAVKFTEEGYIKLNIRPIGEAKDGKQRIRFGVSDSGQGIKASDLYKLGEAFTQVDSKTNHFKEGTGLGLSISSDFIQMMGGTLQITSIYGKGSEFFFEICQGESSGIANDNDSGVSKQAWQEDENFTTQDTRVLVVDDSEVNLMIAKEMLTPLNMVVDTVDSGKKAIELITTNRYDLVLMDYMMPYMDGVETTKRIRELAQKYVNDRTMQAYLNDIPIIALTFDYSTDTKELFVKAGINDFTDKPIIMKKIKKILLKWLPEDKICPEK